MKTACSLKKHKQKQKTKENTNKQQEIKINNKNATKEQKSATASAHPQVCLSILRFRVHDNACQGFSLIVCVKLLFSEESLSGNTC